MTLATFLAELRQEFPFARVTEKRGWFWTLLHYLLIGITFGANRQFLSRYWTTLGPVIGYPQGHVLDDYDVSVLRHERVHLRQTERAGWIILAAATLGLSLLGRRWSWLRAVAFFVGLVPYSLAYLLLPLPAGLAFCRYLIEREAYAESVRCAVERGGPDAAPAAIDHAVAQLTSGAYAWTWPFPGCVRRYFTSAIEAQKELP